MLRKLQAEIDEVSPDLVGETERGRIPCDKDLKPLPYLSAVIKEGLNIIHHLLARNLHTDTSRTQVFDYTVPHLLYLNVSSLPLDSSFPAFFCRRARLSALKDGPSPETPTCSQTWTVSTLIAGLALMKIAPHRCRHKSCHLDRVQGFALVRTWR